ncbi:MAG: hypothetical protein SGARI_007683 [Bacillariaceae sp.]
MPRRSVKDPTNNRGLPQWATKTAVNALAPIEPFKLCHKINENVKRHQPELRERLEEAEMVSTMPPGRSPRPGGMAQLGYACYWPKGGGSVEGGASKPKHSLSENSEGNPDDHNNSENMDSIGGKTNEHENEMARSLTDDEAEAAMFAVDPESS